MTSLVLHIANNKITNLKAAEKFWDELKQKDGKYLVEAKSIRRRSVQQNRFWWGCVVPLVKQGLRSAGYGEVKTDEDAHEVLKAIFLKKKLVSEKNADEIIISGSTAKLTTMEFMELIADVQQWGSSYLSITIPDPGAPSVLFAEYDETVKATIVK